MEALQIIDVISRGGTIVALLYILYGGYKRAWVYGWQYQEALDRIEHLEAQVSQWQEIVLGAQNVSDKLGAISSELLKPRSRLERRLPK